jgi:signal peptidase I
MVKPIRPGIQWWAPLVAAVLIAAGTITLARGYEWFTVNSDVMSPTLARGQRALTGPVGTTVDRGDVVLVDGVHWPRTPDGVRFALRVVAVAGDRVTCCGSGGQLLLNGQPLTEDYASGPTASFGAFDLTVPAGRVFLLGDQRDRSRDSRELMSPDHDHDTHTHDHDGSEAAHSTLATTDLRARVLTVVAPPWRAHQVSASGPLAPHHLALAAVAAGLLVLVAALAPPVVRRGRRLVRRREPTW